MDGNENRGNKSFDVLLVELQNQSDCDGGFLVCSARSI